MAAVESTYEFIKYVVDRLVDPLRADETIKHFTLAIPEAQTTTVDSVQGWANRPPAVVRCAGCGTEIPQRRARSDIDCTYCYRTFGDDRFGELELLSMHCPRCATEMDHGRRHPKVFDVPEWATCPECQYHWDLNHWF
jgi:Zn finger protein HypA/HybF involved in hydrogenase expression